MAIITGVFKGYRGKCGNLVFSQRKGIQIVRSRGIPSRIFTLKQFRHKGKFKFTSRVFRYCTPEWIPPFWSEFARHPKTGWGQMMKANLLSQDDLEFNHEKIVISAGELPNVAFPSVSYKSSSGNFTFLWVNNDIGLASGDDKVSFIIINSSDFTTATFSIAPRARRDLTIVHSFHPGSDANDFLAYICTSQEGISTGGKYMISNTVFQRVIRT